MPNTEGWARRKLRELRDPATARNKAAMYAEPAFLRLFLDDLDERIYRDPQAGLRWAELAPDLALLTPEGDGPEARQEHRGRLVRAWVALGSAYRAAGKPDKAGEPYAEALKLISSESIEPLIVADTYRRLSFLRACQGRPEEALELASKSVGSLRELDLKGDRRPLARALISKGYALYGLDRFNESLASFGEALVTAGKIDKRSKADKRLHSSICHNLAVTVSKTRPRGQSLALGYIRHAREFVQGGRRFSPRYRLLWVEGLIWSALGCYRPAVKRFQIAREGFEALEMPYEIALVSLDLGAVYSFHAEWNKLQPLATDTYLRFRSLSASTQAIAALSQWADAVKFGQLTDEITTKARQAIEARIGPGGCCKSRERSAT